MSRTRLASSAFIVRDYDEAIRWFTDTLGWRLLEDTPIPAQNKRWVLVAPDAGAGLVLARPSGVQQADQQALIGRQFGGRVGYFLETDDFAAEHARLLRRGVRFLESPRRESYGTVAVFEDLYGNRWDLIQRAIE